MKNIRSLTVILIVVLLLLSTGSLLFSQEGETEKTPEKISFSILGGFNLSSVSVKLFDDYEMYGMQPGFNVTGIVDFPFSRLFSIETGLAFTTKGYRAVEDDLTGTPWETGIKSTVYYLDIPLRAKFSFNLDPVRLSIATGPYLGVGLFGTVEKSVLGTVTKEDINWNDDYERIDFGLTTELGLEWNSFLFGIAYDWGLIDISQKDTDNFSVKNHILKFNFGYRF